MSKGEGMNNTREKEILNLIKTNGYVSVKDLAKALSISESSIRRDLTTLQKKGLVSRNYGGAEAIDSVTRNIPFSQRYQLGKNEKKKIAQVAASLVKDGDVIFLDASSTTLYLAHEIAGFNGITVITNGIEIMHLLSSYAVKTICTGGLVYNEDRVMLVGSMALDTVRSIHADIAFVSTQAMSYDGVLSCVYQEANDVRRAMLENADKRAYLCLESKIGKVAPYRLTTLDSIDCFVCDDEAPKDLRDRFPGVRFMHP